MRSIKRGRRLVRIRDSIGVYRTNRYGRHHREQNRVRAHGNNLLSLVSGDHRRRRRRRRIRLLPHQSVRRGTSRTRTRGRFHRSRDERSAHTTTLLCKRGAWCYGRDDTFYAGSETRAFLTILFPCGLSNIQYILRQSVFFFGHWGVTSLLKGGRASRRTSFFVIIIFGRQSFGAIIFGDDDEEFQHERTRRRLCFLFLRGKRKYFNQLANISKSRTNNKKVSC